MNDKLNDLFTNPDWFLFHVDEVQAYFMQMNRMTFKHSIFCDSRIKPVSKRIQPVNLAYLIKASGARENSKTAISFVFHMAHVGSTLLARGLDIPGKNVVYREPQVLRHLGVIAANNQAAGEDPENWKELLALTMQFLGKSYGKTQGVIIKANVPVNFMIPQLMVNNPDSSAILLYSSLENYLFSLLKSGGHRQWVAGIIDELAGGWEHVAGISAKERKALTVPQSIACLWLVQISIYQQMVNRYPGMRTLDSEVLFCHSKATLGAAFSWFGQSIAENQLETIVNGEIFNRHSKNPQMAYDNQQRLADREDLRKTLASELIEAWSWVDKNIGRFNLQEKLPAPLLADHSPLLLGKIFS